MRWIKAGRVIMVSALGWGLVGCSFFEAESGAVKSDALSVKAAEADAGALAEARRFFEQNNPGLALTRVEAFLNANPESASGHNLAGAILDRIGRYDLAESHYQKALAVQPDYLPAVNNFGLSKLQRARASGRAELEQEGEALLARARELATEPERLASIQNAARAELSTKPVATPVAAAAPVPAPTVQRSAWLERRSESYTYVVTKPSLEIAEALALDLDPALVLVSPGATMATTFIAIGPSPREWGRMQAWLAPKGAPRLVSAAPGVSVLSLQSTSRWYRGNPTIQPVTLPAETALDARAKALLTVASLP